MASTRRLAAILAADVAGYSRLMGADEEGTLAELKAIRRELSDPKVKEHRGRIVKTTGDGLLIEFVSVVDAVLPDLWVAQLATDRLQFGERAFLIRAHQPRVARHIGGEDRSKTAGRRDRRPIVGRA